MPDCSRALVTARMPSPWKVWPAPSLSSSTSFVKERSMAIRGLVQGLREPHRDRRHEEHQREHEQAHEQVRHHRAEDVTHGHLRRRHALHGHEQEPMRRQQEAQLHADKEHHAEPHRVDADFLNQRHKDGERDHHHADLLDEEAEEDQHEHHRGDERKRRQAERRDDLDHSVARPGKRQDLREGHRTDDDEEDHSGNGRRAAQRPEQVVDSDRPVGRGQQEGEKRADRGGFGRGGQPADMEATTTTKIETSGTTYWTKGRNFSQPRYSVKVAAGASDGFIFTRTTMYTTKAALRISPGTMPPIRSLEIEIPERLPSKTVNADGGISISTAPIAISGPVAMVG